MWDPSRLGRRSSGRHISTLSAEAIGYETASSRAAAASPASAAPAAANRAYYVPFSVSDQFQAVRMFVLNGATAAGNTDVGIYDEAFKLLVSTGAVAQAGVNVCQYFDITDTTLYPGLRYFMAMSNSNASATFFLITPSLNITRSTGLMMQASAHVLPNPMVPVVGASGVALPVFGILDRTAP